MAEQEKRRVAQAVIATDKLRAKVILHQKGRGSPLQIICLLQQKAEQALNVRITHYGDSIVNPRYLGTTFSPSEGSWKVEAGIRVQKWQIEGPSLWDEDPALVLGRAVELANEKGVLGSGTITVKPEA